MPKRSGDNGSDAIGGSVCKKSKGISAANAGSISSGECCQLGFAVM